MTSLDIRDRPFGRGKMIGAMYQFLVYEDLPIIANKNKQVDYEKIRVQFNELLKIEEQITNNEMTTMITENDVILQFMFLLGITLEFDKLNKSHIEYILTKESNQLPSIEKYMDFKHNNKPQPISLNCSDLELRPLRFHNGITTEISATLHNEIVMIIRKIEKKNKTLLPKNKIIKQKGIMRGIFKKQGTQKMGKADISVGQKILENYDKSIGKKTTYNKGEDMKIKLEDNNHALGSQYIDKNTPNYPDLTHLFENTGEAKIGTGVHFYDREKMSDSKYKTETENGEKMESLLDIMIKREKFRKKLYKESEDECRRYITQAGEATTLAENNSANENVYTKLKFSDSRENMSNQEVMQRKIKDELTENMSKRNEEKARHTTDNLESMRLWESILENRENEPIGQQEQNQREELQNVNTNNSEFNIHPENCSTPNKPASEQQDAEYNDKIDSNLTNIKKLMNNLDIFRLTPRIYAGNLNRMMSLKAITSSRNYGMYNINQADRLAGKNVIRLVSKSTILVDFVK